VSAVSIICPVCGCKTEEIDLIEVEITDGKIISVCDYCNKQIGALKTADDQDPEGLVKVQPKVRWLDAVLAKQVEERDGDCTRFLAALRNKFPRYLSERQGVDFQQNVSQPAPVQYQSVGGSEADQGISDADSKEIEKLRNQLETLEKQFYRLKRNLLISGILEIVVPIILVIIIAIIFFKSDLWGDLSSLIYSATGGAIMY